MELHLKIIGYILIGLALLHGVFPSYFNWKKEFKSISLLSRQIMYIHTFFIALVIFLIGILCLTSSQELIETPLGNKICLGLGFFWFARLYVQFFGYSSKLWRKKHFETIIHIIFVCLWAYISTVFLFIALSIFS
ncbi:hypothetical protein Fleli_2679 [Bernardetia litoralis DSM 6794]|uniref:Uncharacterized protein n=1 Tax=Bernardetia litoralis (strain ATCC 23117 / DSM 6794 / NBRC 15988 / NCIMB 1366 / Fx l1 / Sio-4) TaxID=880071 RepID=I4AM51_BERLS|nr:hypothetical protein [Bernardetia litoralis]AFM05036.1 hypothetical protein Fleli_2679 [Bernardetia litoralis DSM 6794]